MSKAKGESAGSKLTYQDIDKLVEDGRIGEGTADLLFSLVDESGGRPPNSDHSS